MKIDQRSKDIILLLAGQEIERRDQDRYRLWLPYKYKAQEDIKNGIITRQTAVVAYTKLMNLKMHV